MSITVTEAARNFADCVNRAYYQKVTFILLKNGVPCARLTPETEKICTGRELSQTLAQVELPPSEARTWQQERIQARKTLRKPKSRWQ